MNKNISVWRGSNPPPTIYHVWIKQDNQVYLHDGTGWSSIGIGGGSPGNLVDGQAKIDIIDEIPSTDSLKNNEFQLYKLGQDITINDPDFGRGQNFTARAGDLCLLGKVTTEGSNSPEYPKFSTKYKYKIQFDNTDFATYYFGGTCSENQSVNTTEIDQALNYSLLGSSDDFIIKCGEYYAYYNPTYLSLTSNKENAQHFVLHEENGVFQLLLANNLNQALNADEGLGGSKDHSIKIGAWNVGDPSNQVLFIPQETEILVKAIIPTSYATDTYSGLMSATDKAKLDGIAAQANNYSLPLASSNRGGIKIGYTSTANNRAVQLSSEKAYVNIPDVTTTTSGLMLASDKSKLEGLNIYKKTYRQLQSLPTESSGWYTIAKIDDTESSLFQVSTGGHSDVIFTVSTGWKSNPSGSLTILNSFYSEPNDVNGNHVHVKQVRIRKYDNKLQVDLNLNKPISNASNYINVVISAFTNAGHDLLEDTLALSDSQGTVVQTFELQNQAIMADKVVTKTITADNLATVATSGNYNDLSNKPTIPSAVTESTVSGWGFTKNTGYTQVNHGTSDTTFTLTPNTFHVWDEVTSLTLDLGSETSGVANEYLFQFTSGATATTLTLPNTIKWMAAPNIQTNKTYQVSIINNLGVIGEFSNE